ncbi:chromosome transmission fidelity protein 18 homolog [Anguilla anguilla]|uniref:chromosome transmission fidelity protein 18 homolog n=1 Tax=Anguilla anguilla TaxID=7936 RepID=UPI0015A9B01F|nr:chromosome transmission fidelity protein 18 homolog [Anguilla anguilla]
MDEYDEMYGIEDEFEQQFADELEVMAEIDYEPPRQTKVSELRNKKPLSFEDALVSGDLILKKQGAVSLPECSASQQSSVHKPASLLPEALDGSELPEHFLDSDSFHSPKSKRCRQDVAKKLKFGLSDGGHDITPPSSPEDYSRSTSNSVQAVPASTLDISGLGELQASPRRATVATPHVLRRPPASGDYISVTDSSGSRVYLAKKDEDTVRAVDSRALRNSHYSLGLLSVPIEVLMEQVAERRHRQVVEESQRLTEMLNSRIDEEFGELDGGEPEEDEQAAMDEDQDGTASRLWVDRFSPRHYTELLSDDFTNRCLLKWLKLWDTVVFGREKPTKKPKLPQPDNKLSFQQKDQQNPRFKTKIQITEEILEAELDQYQRPKYKVALLSGPPGLGKTTLAHIIAKHAGYNVVEMNASDDRSAELFQKRIDTATQMKSVLGANEKPNCLVIDEIDGAPTAAINVLLATLNRKESRETDAETAGIGSLKKKKKRKTESVLLRPIICICNDLYVPALRQLRQQAFLLTFPPTQSSRLVQRLAEISRRQDMKVDTGALMALCEKTDNDIRSCINTLQFLHRRGQKQLDQRMVQSMTIGLKDQNKGLFSVWQEIFQLPRVKRKRVGEELFAGMDHGGQSSTAAHRLQHILHLASSSGEHEKLTQGLYDNFLSMKLKDPSLRGVCSALEWLGFSDILSETMMHGQNFSLMRYLPFLPAAFHLLFAATSVPRINYPKSQYEALTRTQHTRNALVAMLAEIHPSIRSRVGVLCLSLDVLGLLLEVICPKLRPVNPQLYSMREKQQLVELVDTMLSYNLTYRQDRSPEGQYMYLLEPNVEEAARFPGLPPRRQLTYQAKQMIAREIELERMRRAEAVLQARNPQRRNEEEKNTAKHSGSLKPAARNHQQRLENIVKQTVVETRPEMDFFGRALVPKEKPVSTAASGEEGKAVSVELQMGKAVGNSDVWFRFNEGVSNAVRRNVYIKDLL